jgi:CpeS-like protein
MTSSPIAPAVTANLTLEFFRQSEGGWKSQRRYYTLKQETEPQEVVSFLRVDFLDRGAKELIELAKLHQLESEVALMCGTKVSWESYYTQTDNKPIKGSTIFGIDGNVLYRDRGFATEKPVIAIVNFINPKTMCLRTEYSGSVFEEEVKLIGTKYRTRQTIISRSGKELTIGQYLETRIN